MIRAWPLTPKQVSETGSKQALTASGNQESGHIPTILTDFVFTSSAPIVMGPQWGITFLATGNLPK